MIRFGRKNCVKYFISLTGYETIDQNSSQTDSSHVGPNKKCECGAEISSANLARHKKSDFCMEKQGNCSIDSCVEVVIEPNLINTLNLAGIELDDIIDVRTHDIDIIVKMVANNNGTTDLIIDPIHLDGYSLSVSLANDDLSTSSDIESFDQHAKNA